MRIDKDTRSALLLNFILWISGSTESRRLKQASIFPRISQERVLRQILEQAKDSVYGKEHNFSEILSAKDADDFFELYRKYNEPTEYEHYRPYVNRMMEGEENVLFMGKPVLYATTSGSTGSPKYVPISKTYMENVYGRMTRLWVYNFVKHRPRTFTGKTFTIVGKWWRDTLPTAHPTALYPALRKRMHPK